MITDRNDVHGPIDYLLVEFPAGADTSEAGRALLDLVDSGIVAVYDLLVIRKDADGSFSGLEASDLSDHGVGGFVAFAGAVSGLLQDDDLETAAEMMEPGTVAALVVFENTWARPFVAAARGADAQLISSARIPAAVVMEVLDELETAAAVT